MKMITTRMPMIAALTLSFTYCEPSVALIWLLAAAVKAIGSAPYLRRMEMRLPRRCCRYY